MCCHPRHHAMRGHCGCGSFFRRFISDAEEREMLEDYRKELEKELAGVKERIQKLTKK